MTATKAEFIAQAAVENAATSKYTSPSAGKGSIIDEFTMTNYSGGAITVDVYIGAAASDANRIIHTLSLASHATHSFSELIGRYMAPGSQIFWIASAATSVNGHASGRELT
jgi:hypothetical protein